MFVGQRVADKDGCKGTVRYLGPVATSKNQDTVYAGVEWDDPARGKGNGAVVDSTGTEIRYFTCVVPGATASFLKTELVNTGRDMVAALTDRYCDATVHTGGAIRGTSGKPVPILLVGDEKIREQQRLEKLTAIALRDSLVFSINPAPVAGEAPPPSLGALCPRLREADLRGNLWSSWEPLATLGRELPLLHTLNLGETRLSPLTPATVAELRMGGLFANLRVLVVNDAGLDWGSLVALSAVAPGLEELHACRNGIGRLVDAPATWDAASGAVTTSGEASFLPPALFPCLKTLNLSGNPLGDWGQVYALGRLPCLTWLQVADAGISLVWGSDMSLLAADPASHVPAFASLESLSLAGNPLAHMWCVDALDTLPALTTLRLTNLDIAGAAHELATVARAGPKAAWPVAPSGNPGVSPSEARQIIISRLPRLGCLNNSEVRPREREDAEKAYTRRVGAAVAAGCGKPTPADVFGAKNPLADTRFTGGSSSSSGGGGAAASGGGGAATGATSGGSASAGDAASSSSSSSASSYVALPAAFKKSGDSGVIRSSKPVVDTASPFYTSPYPLHMLSLAVSAMAGSPAAPSLTIDAHPPRYIPSLDLWELGGGEDEATSAWVQAVHPRYFLLAAKFELHAPAPKDAGAMATLASSVVTVTLRPMGGDSCTYEPVVKRLPLSITVAAVKQLAQRLFKSDPLLQRVSYRDASAPYPCLLEDDGKPLSYYAVTEGCELLIEEVDPAEAARQEEEARAARQAKVAEQAAAGEALRRAQELSVTAARSAAVGMAAGGAAAK